MKGIAAVVVVSVLLASRSGAGEVQLFNTDVLGQPTAQPVKLLADKEPDAAEPYVVWADVSCGKYIAASAFYRKPTRLAEVIEALDKAFGKYRVSGGPVWLWRVADKRFAIQAVEEKDSKAIRVTYIAFGDPLKDLANFMAHINEDEPCPVQPTPEK